MLLIRETWSRVPSPFYLHAVRWLGEDEHGDWLAFDAGTPLWRGRELLGHGADSGVVLFPRRQNWSARFPEGRAYEFAIDVIVETEWTDHGVATVDLGVSARMGRDGMLSIVGRDTLAKDVHDAVSPRDVIDLVDHELDGARARLAALPEPFASDWRDWRDRALRFDRGLVAPPPESRP